MVALGLIILIAVIGWGILWAMRSEKADRQSLAARIAEKHSPDIIRYGLNGHFIGFRFGDQIVIYGTRKWDLALPISALKAVEVRKDGVTVTRTNRGSQLAGAAVGGLLFGGVGALIGGLSGSTAAVERVKSLGLAFIFAQTDHPFHEVVFGAWPGNGVPLNGLMAAEALQDTDLMRAHALGQTT